MSSQDSRFEITAIKVNSRIHGGMEKNPCQAAIEYNVIAGKLNSRQPGKCPKSGGQKEAF